MIATRVRFEFALVYVFTASLPAESGVATVAREEVVFGSTRTVQARIFCYATIFEIAKLACQTFGAYAVEFVLVFTAENLKCFKVNIITTSNYERSSIILEFSKI
jgi:hypothetical protein